MVNKKQGDRPYGASDTANRSDGVTANVAAVTDMIENMESVRLDHDAFCEAIGRMPAECRKAFVLGVVLRCSHSELAAHCGIPVDAVKGHIEQGLKLAQAYREERNSLWSL
jgi:DNA-directed RNA polymerase specialized sigma24 family protein